jgi:nucleoside-diphosphate-sugar epimerase
MGFQNQKMLVTGAGGFIGSHLCEELVEMGAEVRAFVRYNSSDSYGLLEKLPPIIFKELEVFSGDIRDPMSVRRAVRECKVVFHLAALVGIPFSYHAPGTYVETNIGGTFNVLQACSDEAVERLVHTSTSLTVRHT